MPLPDRGHFIIHGAPVAYEVERSKRRRRTIGLAIGHEGNIRILAPWRIGSGAIERLIKSQQDWLRRRLDDFERHRHTTVARQFIDGDTFAFQGEKLTLRITQNSDTLQGCSVDGIFLNANFHESPATNDVRLEILLWYKKQAKRIFEERALYWSEKLNLHYRSFAVSNPQRLWGSCSGRNDVRVNWRLIMARPDLLDYVIVHELCHIPQKNHSPRFWRMVDDAMPGCKTLRKELRAMGHNLAL